MKYKILLADDSSVNREYLKTIFEKYSFEVLEASSGQEALDIIEKTIPSVMILDLMMPGIGGLDTLKMIRAKGYHFPIIIFTSDYKDDTKKKCLDAGANEVLYKPTKPQHLLKLISNLFAEAGK
jgi:CheY-like chemotaxis protein